MNMQTTLIALLFSALSTTAVAADYVAVKVEAENYSQKNSLWRLFNNRSQPSVGPDPDGSHHSGASGQAYLELLPDTRVTHSDPLSTGGNFWPAGGQGPAITYSVNFPETGRYTVWVKAYSTGTEDNGIHVGINGSYPGSGERVQWCSGKHQWTWSSAQRASDNHCGTPRTIYLNVSYAGANTINFSAREDGFEFDQFMLIKENVSGLQCSPNHNDQVVCNNTASGTISGGTNDTPPANDASDTGDSSDSGEEDTTSVYPQCQSGTADQDGDGYGWENGGTCLATNNTASATSSDNELPVCTSSISDTDNDGWGWENNQSCVVSAELTSDDASQMPYCASAASDTDNDGWGWENNRSCLVR